jgi:hypothetical protein
MPKGPQGQKRPGDVIGAAITVAKIATGEVTESEATDAHDGKDPAAKALGSKGGRARAKSLTPEERSTIASVAASARWKRDK